MFGTIYLQGTLLPETEIYEHKCVLGGIKDNPARPLEVFIILDLKLNREVPTSYWYKTPGDSAIKRSNSLIDLLEDKRDDWTESQPRRYLAKRATHDRLKASFTS